MKEEAVWNTAQQFLPKKKDKKKSTNGGHKKGAKGWTAPKTDCLLGIVKEILPTGRNYWEKVTLEHSNEYKSTRWDGEDCKHKFERLAFQEKPTGSTRSRDN